jgi:hypothetical protein
MRSDIICWSRDKVRYSGDKVGCKNGWPEHVGDESSRSLMLPKVVDEQVVKCGVVLTQPSQESQYDIDADEPPLFEVMKQC